MGWWGRWRGTELPLRDRGPERVSGGETQGGVKHGVWIEEGQYSWKLVESIYRRGVRQGPYREWHADRWLLERGTFVDGEKDGDVEFFSKEGRRIAVAAHRAGKWHGAYRQFHADGSIELEREYRDGNIYAGPYDLKAHDDGRYIWRKTFRDGHPIGLFEEYRVGRLQLHANYDDDGVLDGPWHDHYEGGEVRLEGAYAKGARTGVWQWHRKDGVIVARCDYDGERAWTTADGARLDVRDDADFPRWIGLAEATAGAGANRTWYSIERAIDAWPEDDRARAVAWAEAKLGPHTITVGIGEWLGALIERDGDPRCRLIGGISTDHGRFRAEHVARMVRHAGAMRVLSFDEEDLEPSVDALFPPGVAWPKLEKLWIHESGPLGTLVRTLAEAPWASSLRDLGLDGEGAVSDDDSAALIASPHLASLRSLYLSGFGRVANAIATAPMFATLEELELRYPGDAVAVVEAIAARETPALKSLELYGEGRLSRNTIIGLCAKARHPALESLTLQDFDVPEAIEEEIARRWPSLRLYVY